MVKALLVLLSLLFTTQIFANNADILKSGLVKPTVKDPLINEVVSFKPVKDHHFNLEAPQECGAESTIDPSAKTITCQFHNSGARKVRLSVCDNAKKYCKQELIDVSVRDKKSGTPRIKTAPKAETVAMQAKTKKLLMASFKSMSPAEAIQAVSTKKAVLAMVSTDWCPPCNMAKEFLLPSPEFKEATKDLLMVYVDGDNPLSDAWKPYLKSRFYPTFVVLNKKLESVALFTDGNIKTHVSKLNAGLNKLKDPYKSLTARIDNRLNGNLVQKIADFFNSDESIKADEERFLDYLQTRAKFLEKIDYMKKFSKDKYATDLLVSEQMAEMFGLIIKEESKLSEDEKKAKELTSLKTLLEVKVDKNDMYYSNLQSFCSKTKETETNNNSKECLKYSEKLFSHIKTKDLESTKDVSAVEKKLSTAGQHYTMASIHSFLGNDEKAAALADNCFNEYQGLYKLSPLKEKSRSVRLQQLYCLKYKKESGKDEFKLLSSLVKDYPFEETFQRKLASYYLKKKNYKKASEYNEKALRYSYGAMWAYNMSAKAKILKGENKKEDALVVLDKALKEIVLEKEGRSSNTIKTLRSQYEKLKAELNPTKTI